MKIVYDSQDSLLREIEALRIVGDHENVVALECDELVLVEVGGDHEAHAAGDDQRTVETSTERPRRRSTSGGSEGSMPSSDGADSVVGEGDLCMITELCSGDLLQEVSERAVAGHSGLGPADALRIFAQVCSAVAHCHRAGVYHCDIKPENILMSEERIPKLSDFGACVFTRHVSKESVSEEHFGSLEFLAPELLSLHADGRRRALAVDQRSTEYIRKLSSISSVSSSAASDERARTPQRCLVSADKARIVVTGECACGGFHGDEVDFAAVDVWALGVLLFTIVTGEHPWGRAHVGDIAFSRYVNNDLDWPYLPKDINELLHCMLNPDPCARPTAAQLAELQWLQKGDLPRGESPHTTEVVLPLRGCELSPTMRGVPPALASRVELLPEPAKSVTQSSIDRPVAAAEVTTPVGKAASPSVLALPPSVAARVCLLPEPAELLREPDGDSFGGYFGPSQPAGTEAAASPRPPSETTGGQELGTRRDRREAASPVALPLLPPSSGADGRRTRRRSLSAVLSVGEADFTRKRSFEASGDTPTRHDISISPTLGVGSVDGPSWLTVLDEDDPSDSAGSPLLSSGAAGRLRTGAVREASFDRRLMAASRSQRPSPLKKTVSWTGPRLRVSRANSMTHFPEGIATQRSMSQARLAIPTLGSESDAGTSPQHDGTGGAGERAPTRRRINRSASTSVLDASMRADAHGPSVWHARVLNGNIARSAQRAAV